jgi:dihydroflavonol-4-reductase
MPRRIPPQVALAVAALMEFVIAPRTGKTPKFLYEEALAASLYRIADSSKAIHELGLPQRPLRDTLKETVDWLQAAGHGSG